MSKKKKIQTQKAAKYWVRTVPRKASPRLKLERGIFSWDDPAKIARSMKKATLQLNEEDNRFKIAISVITFHINRSGKNISEKQKVVLNSAKQEIRRQFGRPALPVDAHSDS